MAERQIFGPLRLSQSPSLFVRHRAVKFEEVQFRPLKGWEPTYCRFRTSLTVVSNGSSHSLLPRLELVEPFSRKYAGKGKQTMLL